MVPADQKVAVLGGGTMGSGIAQVCAQAGFEVIVLEQSQELWERARQSIEAFLTKGVSIGKVTEDEKAACLDRLSGTTQISELAGSDVVIEAIVERLDEKLELLAEVAAVIGPDALIATNTSALSVSAIAAGVDRPERVAGLHFFNPAPIMKLVEVVRAEQSSEQTVSYFEAFATAIGKEAVVTKDRPGFLVNRLFMPYINQLIQDYDDGIASAEDLDAALELGLGYPMGGLKLIDVIGIDVHHHATSAAWEQTRDPRFVPPPVLERKIAAGELGRKTGKGFLEYQE